MIGNDRRIHTAAVYDICRIELHDAAKSALLLGYRVQFTEAEYRLISLLVKNAGRLHRDELADRSGIAPPSIPVHVANINKKAYPITKRRLIIGGRGGDYGINKYM